MNNEMMEKVKAKHSKRRLTRARAIKLYCKTQCCVDDLTSWRQCAITGCFLWQFRMGKEIFANKTSFTKKTAYLGVLARKKAIPQPITTPIAQIGESEQAEQPKIPEEPPIQPLS